MKSVLKLLSHWSEFDFVISLNRLKFVIEYLTRWHGFTVSHKNNVFQSRFSGNSFQDTKINSLQCYILSQIFLTCFGEVR